MKLSKYNLSYNTRDLLHSLAKSTCERKRKSIYLFLLKLLSRNVDDNKVEIVNAKCCFWSGGSEQKES